MAAAAADKAAATFGIHIGSTSMSIAVNATGRPEVLANPAGERVTPAVVRYMEGEQVRRHSRTHRGKATSRTGG